MPELADPRLRTALERISPRVTAVTLSDLSQTDSPLVFVNRAFEEMTGYAAQEVVGRNCRFLQGEGTDREAVARIRLAVETASETVTCLLNYRRDGTAFHNLLMLSPVHAAQGGPYMLGCQYVLRPGMFTRSLDEQVARVQGVAGALNDGLRVPNPI